MYAHNAYHHVHPQTAQIAAHFTHAQYPHNNHHHAVHKVHNIQLHSLELLADINSCSPLAEQVNDISHHHDVSLNGLAVAHLHFNLLFAKFTIFAA
jgi:hypothetical protein